MQNNKNIVDAHYIGIISTGEFEVFGKKEYCAENTYEAIEFEIIRRGRNSRIGKIIKNRTIYYSIPLDDKVDNYQQKIVIEEYSSELVRDWSKNGWKVKGRILLQPGEKRTILENAMEMAEAPLAYKFFKKPIPEPIWNEYEVNCELVHLYKINELLELSKSSFTKEECIAALEKAKEQYEIDKNKEPMYLKYLDSDQLINRINISLTRTRPQ